MTPGGQAVENKSAQRGSINAGQNADEKRSNTGVFQSQITSAMNRNTKFVTKF
jgi:hypothetical protein